MCSCRDFCQACFIYRLKKKSSMNSYSKLEYLFPEYGSNTHSLKKLSDTESWPGLLSPCLQARSTCTCEHMLMAKGLPLSSLRVQHRPQGAPQCRHVAGCNRCWGKQAQPPKRNATKCSVSFYISYRLPWSMTQRVRLLLGSLRDFRGTVLIRRAKALSRPWPETPTSVSSSKRLLMRTFSSRAGSGNKKI